MNSKRILVLTGLSLTALVIVIFFWSSYYLSGSTDEVTVDESDVSVTSTPAPTPFTRRIEGIDAVDDLNDLLFLPGQNRFLITSFDESKIYVLNPGTFSIDGEIPLASPHKLHLEEQLDSFFVSLGKGKVARVSLSSFAVLDEVDVGKKPSEMVVDVVQGNLFVINEFSNSVSVVDIDSFEVIKTINVGVRPIDIALHPDGDAVYVANERDASVSVISTGSLAVVDTIYDVGRPSKMLVIPERDSLFVLDRFSNVVISIDIDQNSISERISTVRLPVDVVLGADRKTLYVASFIDNSIGVIDLEVPEMTNEIVLGSSFDSEGGLNNIGLVDGTSSVIVTNTNIGQVYRVVFD